MKKLIFTLVLTFSVSYGFSQMNTGSYFVSGSIPLDLQLYSGSDKLNSDVKESYQHLTIAPKGGYFIKNRLAVGGMVEYSADRTKTDDGSGVSKYVSSQVLAGPLARYYYEYGKFLPFVEAMLGVGRQNIKSIFESGGESFESNSAHSVFKVAAGGGAHYFLTDALAFEALLQYFWETQNATEGDGGHNYTGILLLVGITIYFGSI